LILEVGRVRLLWHDASFGVDSMLITSLSATYVVFLKKNCILYAHME
jgi:hypothetical protein